MLLAKSQGLERKLQLSNLGCRTIFLYRLAVVFITKRNAFIQRKLRLEPLLLCIQRSQLMPPRCLPFEDFPGISHREKTPGLDLDYAEGTMDPFWAVDALGYPQ